MPKRSKQGTERVKLMRSYIGMSRDEFKDTLGDVSVAPIPEHVEVRAIAPIHVRVPNQVSEDPREIALRHGRTNGKSESTGLRSFAFPFVTEQEHGSV